MNMLMMYNIVYGNVEQNRTHIYILYVMDIMLTEHVHGEVVLKT